MLSNHTWPVAIVSDSLAIQYTNTVPFSLSHSLKRITFFLLMLLSTFALFVRNRQCIPNKSETKMVSYPSQSARAAITKHHTLGGLMTRHCFLTVLVGGSLR